MSHNDQNSSSRRNGRCRITFNALGTAMKMILTSLASRLAGREHECLAPERADMDRIIVRQCRTLITQAGACNYHGVRWSVAIGSLPVCTVDAKTFLEVLRRLYRTVDLRQTAANMGCSPADLLRHDRQVLDAARHVVIHYEACAGTKDRKREELRRSGR